MSAEVMVWFASMVLFVATERSSLFLAASTPSATKIFSSPSSISRRRMSRTMRFSPSGPSEPAWSVPFMRRSRVMCFSIMVAPMATAATGTDIPIV